MGKECPTSLCCFVLLFQPGGVHLWPQLLTEGLAQCLSELHENLSRNAEARDLRDRQMKQYSLFNSNTYVQQVRKRAWVIPTQT